MPVALARSYVGGEAEPELTLAPSAALSQGLVLTFSPLGASDPTLLCIPFASRASSSSLADITRSLDMTTLRSSSNTAGAHSSSLLGSIPSLPPLPSFTRPPLLPELFLILLLLLFQLLTALASPSSHIPLLVRLATFRDGGYLPGGPSTVRWSYIFLVLAHTLEALWFARKLLRERAVAAKDVRKWVLWTLAVGLAPMQPHYSRSLARERVRLLYARAAERGLRLGPPKGQEQLVEGEGRKTR